MVDTTAIIVELVHILQQVHHVAAVLIQVNVFFFPLLLFLIIIASLVARARL